MTTTIQKVIGTSGDYTTLQAWEDACPADLTVVDEIWQGLCVDQTFSTSSGALLTISGTTTSASQFVQLTTQAAASFRDRSNVQSNNLRYDDTLGAALSSTATYAYLISNSCEYTRISKLQMQQTSATGRGVDMRTGGISNAQVDGCIIEGAFASGTSYAPLRMYGSGMQVSNTLIVQRGSGQSCIALMMNGAQAYNCTFAVPSDKTAATHAVVGAYGATAFENCAFFGMLGLSSGGSTPTFTTCYADAAAVGTGPNGAGNTGVAYSSAGFVNTTDAARDYRIQSGSPLINAGTTDSTHAATDIAGTARTSGSYDVGAWEYVSGGSPVTVSITGLAITSGHGTVSPSVSGQPVSVSITGLRVASSQGTVTPGIVGNVTVSIAGQQITTSIGSLTTVHIASIAGQQITSSQGALGTSHDVGISGLSATFSQGTLVPAAPGNVTVSIGGLRMTMSMGNPATNHEVTLTGNAAALSQGSVTASGGTGISIWTHVGRGLGLWHKL